MAFYYATTTTLSGQETFSVAISFGALPRQVAFGSTPKIKMRLKVNAILLFCISLFPVTRGIVFDLERLSIDQILKTVSENVSCVEITQYFLYRIRKYNPKINAIITVDERGALDQAERLDSYYKKHKSFIGKLHCAPALVKDNILVKGMPMTLGIGYFVNATSANDAPAVQRMKEAGAVILGKANLTPLAMSAPETPSVGGRVWNPHSMGDSASSSSNGNAAALAARLCVIGKWFAYVSGFGLANLIRYI